MSSRDDFASTGAGVVHPPAARELPLLEMINISKTFPGVRANDRITLHVMPGEIHALLGENGAGKSTLMNVLYGLIEPDEGEIRLRGQKVVLASPRDAIRHGIGMVHQHFTLVPTLTVAENVALGLRSPHHPLLDLSAVAKRIGELGISIDPWARVADLSVGPQQRVEILKALCRGAQILVLDEPTAVLTPAETRDLFAMLRRLKGEGRSVVLISHKLEEILEISDRITVLRDGRVVGEAVSGEADRQSLARMMVGRDVSFDFDTRQEPMEEKTLLEVRDLVVAGHPGLRNVTFSVRAGEIFAIAGVDGNGQTELARAIAGLIRVQKGEIRVNGADVARLSVKQRAKRGLAYIPEDRHAMGVVLDFSVADNLILRRAREFARHGLLDRRRISTYARGQCEKYSVRTPSVWTKMRKLSGGNQQRVVIAREISSDTVIVLAVHPTRGLDVGATEYVLRSMLDLRRRGAAILYISGELEEILAISDRVGVLFQGQLLDVLSTKEVDVETIGLLMAGSRRARDGTEAMRLAHSTL